MMLKEKSSPWARLKYLYVLPVAAIAVTAFARPEISETTNEISAVKVNDLAAIAETKVAESVVPPISNTLLADTTKPAGIKYIPTEVKEQLNGKVSENADQLPVFPGGISALMAYFQNNMRYPESAKARGVEGRVTVSFVVDKDGSVKDPVVIRSVDKELDAEAIRLIMTLPKWEPAKLKDKPVAVKFTAPITFKLRDKSPAASIPSPLYIVDGVEVSSAIMNALEPNKIGEVTILKGESAVKVYGEKGKHGVLLITLKKKDALSAAINLIQGSAQDAMKVVGVVTDAQGAPVVGAAVLIEGTASGTISDADGRFVLSVPGKDAVLLVSYINMQTAKVKASPKMAITLKDE